MDSRQLEDLVSLALNPSISLTASSYQTLELCSIEELSMLDRAISRRLAAAQLALMTNKQRLAKRLSRCWSLPMQQ